VTSKIRILGTVTSALVIVGLVCFPAAAGATTWTVNVGQGGSHFVDQVTGTSTSRIAIGDTVHWVWVGGFHSTTSGSCSPSCTPDGIWDSGASGAPHTFDHTFNASTGSFPYYCRIHLASMTGMVIVSALPAVTNANPPSGPSAGGTSVTITGTNFQTGATVTFGGTAATNVMFGGPTTLTATTPVHAPGMVDVVVTNPDLGSATLTNGYNYTPSPAPGVTSVTPPSGPTTGGTAVTISGSNFQNGATLTFGANPATNVAFVDVNTLTGTTPAGPLGPADVTVLNPDTQSGTLTGGFDYQGPGVSSIAPNSGPDAGGTPVTITGSNFVSPATVTIDGISATSVVVTNNTQITATTGVGSAGLVGDVVVTNPDAQSGTLASAFLYDFLDVPGSNPFHSFIVKMALDGITAGCGGGNFCPASSIIRSQMAVFLLRAEHGSGYTPPSANCATFPFTDVACPSVIADYVQQMVNEGITGGCTPTTFCPNASVLRNSMAVFLLVAEHGSGYAPPACTPPGQFTDVPCPGGGFTNWIYQLVAEGITGGCTATAYCPSNPVSRAQMSVFLVTAFNLP
jgi:plastocyanin